MATALIRAIISSVALSTGKTAPEAADVYNARADSMTMALINQIGVLGMLLFYALIALAAWRDRPALPIYLVMFLASLTINLWELFPVNFMLGLLLGRSLLFAEEELFQVQRG